MNNLTEDQARERECPMTKGRDHRGEAKCCASGCMGWQWAEDAVSGETVHDASGNPLGFCGACRAVTPAATTA